MLQGKSSDHQFSRATRRTPFECIALAPQGGGELGSYQGGVAEVYLHPSWVAGVSIGAVDSALRAANPPWIGRNAKRSGRRPMLLSGWELLPLRGVLYAAFSGPYVPVVCRVLNGFSSTVSLTLGALGVAISIGASLGRSFTTVAAAVFGGKVAYLGLALVGLCGLLLLWVGMPATHPRTAVGAEPTSAERNIVTPVRPTASNRPANPTRRT